MKPFMCGLKYLNNLDFNLIRIGLGYLVFLLTLVYHKIIHCNSISNKNKNIL